MFQQMFCDFSELRRMVGVIPSLSYGCQFDRGPGAFDAAVRIGAVVEQPGDAIFVELCAGGVERGTAVGACGMD